jgi:hypothetical protein
MTDKTTITSWIGSYGLAALLIIIAIGLLCGAYALLGILAGGQEMIPRAPENDMEFPAGAGYCANNDYANDGTTCCYNRFNLQEENRNAMAPPTVVDINEATGNLLVRGPMPLLIRTGAGNPPQTLGCKNHDDWSFALANLNEMIAAEKSFVPSYFAPAKGTVLKNDLENFNISDYQLIVISLVDNGDVDSKYLSIEQRDFGGAVSQCSATLVPGTIDGQPGNMVISTTGFCDGSDPSGAQCQIRLTKDADGYCSYANLIGQIEFLMNEKDPSGKKRLIYFHCVLGNDRTGGVTMGYLMKTVGLSYADAETAATNLGDPAGRAHQPNAASRTLALAYCQQIEGTCPAHISGLTVEGTGAATTVSTPLPTITPTPLVLPQQTITTAPAQTAVPAGHYNPDSGDTHF